MQTIRFLLFFLSLSVVATHAAADDRYLRERADRLESMSHEIARELRYTGEYRSLRDDAEQLAREARRFREALAGRRDNHYMQTRYREMESRYHRFESRYRSTYFPRQYGHVHNRYVSITLVFHDLYGGWLSLANEGYYPRRQAERVIIREAPMIRHVPFGSPRNEHFDDRSNRRRDDWFDHDDRRGSREGFGDRDDDRGRGGGRERDNDNGRRNHARE